jgi:hypothetical protein
MLAEVVISSEVATLLLGSAITAVAYLVATVQKIDRRLTVIETIWRQVGIVKDDKDED